MPAQNSIIGDSYGTDLPKTQVPEQDLVQEKKMARFSKSKEFQVLKKHLEERIAYYQVFLPDGRPVTNGVTGDEWIIANTIIGEFQAIIAAYENARAAVKESDGGTV